MKIRTSTGRRRRLTPLLLTTTALTTVAPALASATLALALTAGTVQAEDLWRGTISGDWFTAGNWADGSVPTAADGAVLNRTTPNITKIGPGGPANASWLSVGAVGDGALLVHSGGDLTSGSGSVGRTSLGGVTLMGAGSTWSTGSLKVGDYAQGIMAIASGSAVSSVDTYLGYNAQGDATVTGMNSRWTITGDFTLGGGDPWVTGDGELVIMDRGSVTSVDTTLGQGDGSEGEVTVTGAGSTWTNSGHLYIGEHGTGTLNIEDGGAVATGGLAAVGRDSGGIGTAIVTGPGSTWTTNGFLNIGDQPGSQGTLTIADQGTVISNSQVRLANAPGARGSALVTGAGSKWIGTPSQFHVGFWDEGSLTIADGGEVSGAMFTTIGTWGGSSGTVTVTGPGSTWNNTGELNVGWEGTGTLTVADGGTVTNTNGVIGNALDAVGEVTVTGTTSTWTNGGTLFVGVEGSGTLTIAGQGTVNSSGVYAAWNSLATGDMTVTGSGSTWNAGGFYVGGYGIGTLTVADGGDINSTSGDLGVYDGSGFATVTGSGSTWTNTSYMMIGEYGAGTLTIEDGGKVSNTEGYIGYEAGSVGDVTVKGTGSAWTNSGELRVGDLGSGGLTIEAGGKVGNTSGYIAYGPSGVGEVVVTGAGSEWTNSGVVEVGFNGTGTLTVENGGVVTGTLGYVGALSGSHGTAIVTGANSKWVSSSALAVGHTGVGLLTIGAGGTVESFGGNIGYNSAAAPSAATVTGAGSTWKNSAHLTIGRGGTGALTIADGATVSGTSATLGSFAGSRGMATITGPTSKWTNASFLSIGENGAGSLAAADGAVAASPIIYVATNAGSEGVVSVGAASGGAPTAPGALDTVLMQFGAGDGSLVFNHTATNYLFAPDVAGVGQINLLAGTTEINNAAGFSGATSVNSGATLVENGMLGGTLDVLAGGRLEGSGTVTGNTTVAGTVAPGNSIGTLHVAGNYTQAAGSIYEVEVNAAGNSDLVDVTGTATLNGGTVEVVAFPDFALATPYTILTAAGGITGTFDGATMGASSAFLSPQLTYGANDVTFAVSQTASFGSAALTPNQEAAAGGADSLGAGNPVWNAIALLPSASDAQAAFDALSGEVHATASSVLIEDSRFLRDAVDSRLRAAFAGVGANALPVLAYGEDGPEIAPADIGRFAAWGDAFGSWGEWDGDGNAAGVTRDTGGFFVGGDMEVAEVWRLGLLAGYGRSSFDIAERASSGSADSYHLGAYAGTEIGRFGLRFGGAYSWHDVDTSRTASFPGFVDSLSAEYKAATAQLFGEAGYRIDIAHASFEPFASLAYVDLHTDGFTESGGPAALTAASSSHGTTFTTLGLRAETALPLGGVSARLHGMLGWRHAFGDVTPAADLAFTGGGAFTIAGVPIAENAAVMEAGLEFDVAANAILGIAYKGQIGDGASDHGLKARFGMRF